MTGTQITDQVKKLDTRIIFICWLAYAAAYVGRLNYSACLVAVISDLNVTKDAAGLVSSYFFFAYGIGQLVNGILSKKYNARIMVFLSLFISAILNIVMALCRDVGIMKYIWLLNGIVQSVLWSTLVKTISERVSEAMLPKAILVMSTPNIAGTFIVYGLSALLVKIGQWQTVFTISAGVLFITSIVWFLLFGNSPGIPVAETDKAGGLQKISRALLPALIIAAISGIANGFIKDGVTTWTTSVLYEEFDISQSLSILLTLLLPLISAVGALFVERLHKKIRSHTVMNFIFYGISSFMCAGILYALKIHSVILVMLCFVCIACVMSMINNVVTSVFPLDNRALADAGFAAGLLNTFCYLGSTVASYSLGAVSQRGGWSTVFVIMLSASVFSLIVCGIGSIRKKRITSC